MQVNDAGTLKPVLMVIVNDNGTLRRVNLLSLNNAGAVANDQYNVIHTTMIATSKVTSRLSSKTTSYLYAVQTSRATSASVSYTTSWTTSYTTSYVSARNTSVPVSYTTSWTTSWQTVQDCVLGNAVIEKADGSKISMEDLYAQVHRGDDVKLCSYSLPELRPETDANSDYMKWTQPSLDNALKVETNIASLVSHTVYKMIEVNVDGYKKPIIVTHSHPFLVMSPLGNYRFVRASDIDSSYSILDHDLISHKVVGTNHLKGEWTIYKLDCEPYDIFIHDNIIAHNKAMITVWKTTSAPASRTTTRNSTWSTSVPVSKTTTAPASKTTTRSSSYYTYYNTLYPTSRSTNVSVPYTASYNVTGFMRITANNAGGYVYTAVANSTTYGHSYVSSGTWVETT